MQFHLAPQPPFRFATFAMTPWWRAALSLAHLAILPFVLASTPSGAEPEAPADWGKFQQKVEYRAWIDAFGAAYMRVESTPRPIVEAGAAPQQKGAKPSPLTEQNRTLSPALIKARADSPESVPVPPGFIAPILRRASGAIAWESSLSAASQENAALFKLMEDSLSRDGLLVALARLIDRIGPANVLRDPEKWDRILADLGAPLDWLDHFQWRGPGGAKHELRNGWLRRIAAWLHDGESIPAVSERLKRVAFDFDPTHHDFVAAEESGAGPIQLVRLQMQGGYQSGVTSGGALHVARQLAAVLPESDFLVSAPLEFISLVREMVVDSWSRQGTRAVTLVPETAVSTAWAQDSGKAGSLDSGGPLLQPATLAPRFASQGEDRSLFWPHESFVMDGLAEIGHQVMHSPLLFQGGNLLVVLDPVRNERVLIVSETTVFRNVQLGLSPAQVLEALEAEFAVDRCVLLPMVSYHLDYDVTARSMPDGVTVFVNDPAAGAAKVVAAGLAAFSRAGILSESAVQKLRQQVAGGNINELGRGLAQLQRVIRNQSGELKASFAAHFREGSADAGDFNLQLFLAAFDILASKSIHVSSENADEVTVRYFEALRGLLTELDHQRAVLRDQGWKVVAVPSLPDIHFGVNYLNGLHGEDVYLMPAMGGLYAEVDRAAAQVFESALGPGIKVVPILSQDLQRQHGALHCFASAYPAPDSSLRLKQL